MSVMQRDLIQVPTEREARVLTGARRRDAAGGPTKAKYPGGSAIADHYGSRDCAPSGAGQPAQHANRLSVLLIAAVSAALVAFQSLKASERAAPVPPPTQGSSERAKFPHDKAKHRALD